jgi:hypothetical protein
VPEQKDKDTAALELFERMASNREEHQAGISVDAVPLRVRLATDVDLSLASDDCPRCEGRGVVRFEQAGNQRVPVVCGCVSRNGGVSEDRLDQVLTREPGNRAARRAARAARRRRSTH